MFEGKKAIVLGERDGVPGPAIAACMEAVGAEVIFTATECFVWTAAGAMDMENQTTIKNLADDNGTENMMVVLGATDLQGAEITATTLISGDPSFTGPLAGASLGLPVFHILEPEVKNALPEDVYAEQVGFMEMVVDTNEIGSVFRKIRDAK